MTYNNTIDKSLKVYKLSYVYCTVPEEMEVSTILLLVQETYCLVEIPKDHYINT